MAGTFLYGHGAAASQLPANLGQLVSAQSLSVVLASDYTLPVTIASAANNPLFVELTDGTTAYKAPISAQFPTTIGAKLSAASLSVVIASDSSVAATQSGSWTFTSTQLPTTLGQTTKAGSTSVTLASDQGALAVSQSGTWNIGTVTTLTGITNTVNVSVQNATLATTQSGTWTVQPGNTANSTPWLVTDSACGPVTAGTVASKSSLMGVQFNTSLPTLTTGQQSAIQADSSGRILIGALTTGANVIGAVTQSGTWNVGTVTAVTAITNALPTGANVIGAVTQSGTWSTRLNDGAGTSVTVGQKAMASSLPVTIASDQGALGSITQTGIDYNTGLAGATTQRVTEAGRAKAWLARNDYTTTSVTTGAYVQLVASTSAATTRLRIFDSSGSAMILATGAALSEVDQLYIPPGGWDAPIEFNIASGTRISLKALDAAAAVGQIVITALS